MAQRSLPAPATGWIPPANSPERGKMSLGSGICSILPGQSPEVGTAGNLHHHHSGVGADPSPVQRELYPSCSRQESPLEVLKLALAAEEVCEAKPHALWMDKKEGAMAFPQVFPSLGLPNEDESNPFSAGDVHGPLLRAWKALQLKRGVI